MEDGFSFSGAPDAPVRAERERGFDFTAPPAEAPYASGLDAVLAEEAVSHRPAVTAALDRLAHDPADRPALATLARFYHTMAGSAGSLGRGGPAAIAAALRATVETAHDGGGLSPGAVATVRHETVRLFADLAAGVTRAAPTTALDAVVREAFAIEAAELLDSLDNGVLAWEGGQPYAALEGDLLRAWHTLKGAANSVGLPAVGRVAHAAEDALPRLAGDARAGGRLLAVQAALRRAVVADPTAIDADALCAALAADASPGSDATVAPEPTAAAVVSDEAQSPTERWVRLGTDRLDHLMRLAGELVISRARLDAQVTGLASLQSELRISRARLTETVEGFRTRWEFGGLDGRRRAVVAGVAAERPADDAFTELELDHYDDIHVLARALGEIDADVAEAQAALATGLERIGEDADRFHRLVGELQGEVTRARMVAVDQLFARLRLAARDAAERGTCEVRVTVRGAAVTLDKAIVDAVHLPLLHLVRNAVAHGIEDAATRAEAGKDVIGTITLAANQADGQVVITVSDDGGGLHLAALRQAGACAGLIAADLALEDPAVAALIFTPGLSTAASVDAVAGRGYGCDIARREIARLHGTIAVTSTPGRGTAFTITLPATLAASRALGIRQGGLACAVPMDAVERVIEFDGVTSDDGMIAVEGRRIPLRRLADAFDQPAPTAGGPALVLRLGDRRWALQVDVLGQFQDIVVQPLGDLLADHPLFIGVTLDGRGELVPVLDVRGLADALPAAAPRAALPGATPSQAVARVRRVLVVDDSLSVRTVAARLLRELGADPLLAVDGAEALERLRESAVDLVLTDLEMPRVNGYELLREIRQQPALRALPVVVVSSRAGQKHRDAATAAGANAYLAKPFTIEHLAGLLATWTHR